MSIHFEGQKSSSQGQKSQMSTFISDGKCLHCVSKKTGLLRLILTTSPIHNVHSLFLADRLINSKFTALKSFKLVENQLHCFYSNGNDLTLCLKTRTLRYFDVTRSKVL